MTRIVMQNPPVAWLTRNLCESSSICEERGIRIGSNWGHLFSVFYLLFQIHGNRG